MITIKNNMFHLATENTSYIFYINESGIAEHLYYGKRLKNPEYDIDALREKKAAVITKDAEQEMLRKRIDEMRQFLQMQTNRVTEYDEQMVRRLIEKITVFDDKLIFEFKSGMTLELKR